MKESLATNGAYTAHMADYNVPLYSYAYIRALFISLYKSYSKYKKKIQSYKNKHTQITDEKNVVPS